MYKPRIRVAVLSMHTSPLAQPGVGDAGGMNVYVLNSAIELAKQGVAVDIFTRAQSSHDQAAVTVADGVVVRTIVAGPLEALDKSEVPAQFCAFTSGVLRTEASCGPGYYDVVHSHYWVSGHVGWLLKERWGIPLVHTAHTLAAVKNMSLAHSDTPEPRSREVGEQQIIAEADRLIANTSYEAEQLVQYYHADPYRIDVVNPGIDLGVYRPGSQQLAREKLSQLLGVSIDQDDCVMGFAGRLQLLKGPDILLKAAAPLIRDGIAGYRKVRVVIVGGSSGSDSNQRDVLDQLAQQLGIGDSVHFLDPQPSGILSSVYRAMTVLAVPSYSESFGFVALEAQASGTPVIAAQVGGLMVAVADGRSGILVDSHDWQQWSQTLRAVLSDPVRLAQLAHQAPRHVSQFSWKDTAHNLIVSYDRAMSARANGSETYGGLRMVGAASGHRSRYTSDHRANPAMPLREAGQ